MRMHLPICVYTCCGLGLLCIGVCVCDGACVCVVGWWVVVVGGDGGNGGNIDNAL